MKNTKKLLALLLVVAMVFALAVPVFADEETPAMAGKTVAKEIYVKGKLVNIAVKG